jgi:DNA-binding transcriptional ArsR family regulator
MPTLRDSRGTYMTIFYGPRYEQVPAMFDALSCGTRRSILYLLQNPGLTAVDMTSHVGIRAQTVSEHLAVLSRAGLVERNGWSRYCIDYEGVRLLGAFIREHFGDPEPTRRMF